MEEEEIVGCISCMSSNDLCDLFAVYSENEDTYAKMFETCFDIKVANGMKYLCSYCVEKLEAAVSFKEQTIKNMAVIQSIKEEEYLDEAILEEADSQTAGPNRVQIHKKEPADNGYNDDIDEDHAIQALDETTCIYCNLQFGTVAEVHDHIRNIHELEPRTGQKLRECALCGICMRDPADHLNRCHGVKSESGGRQYPCHFCDNIYNSKKACFTHLRMKHGCWCLYSKTIENYVPTSQEA